MKKIIIMLTAVLMSFTSNATLLTVDVDDLTSYHVGDVISADIIVSDIEDDGFGFSKLITSFNFNLLFDDTLLEFSSATFGEKLDVDPDPFFASDQYTTLVSAGDLKLEEIAYAFPSDLFIAQFSLNDFILATVNFNALQAGTSLLSLANVDLGDDWGNAFLNVTTVNKSITVASSLAVPEPSSLFLLLGAMVLFLGRRAL